MADTFKYKRIRLESVSEHSSDVSDTESVHSLQDKETEYVRDTSDTSEDFQYEVTELPDSRNVLLSSSDESVLQDIAELGVVVASLAYEDNLDIAIQADTSEENSTSPTSNSDVDPELPRCDYLDFQHCLICNTEDKNISYPYCPQCFLWKKSFFPPRPEKKKSRSSQSTNKSSIMSQSANESKDESNDHRMKSSSSSAGKLSSQESGFDEASYNSSDDKSLCKTCFATKMNGVFIHGSTGHMHSCYNCAKKTWKSIGVCPLCRKRCQKVIKLYTSFNP